MQQHSEPAPAFLSRLWREQVRLVCLCWPYLLGYVVLASALYSYIGIYHYDASLAYSWMGIANIGLTYVVLMVLMRRGGHLPDGAASWIGSYFFLVLATSIAIAIGLVVLIVPGLYLMMRWLPVFARAMAEGGWIGNAMRWSWAATMPVQKPLGIALAGPVAVLIASLLAGFSYDWVGQESWTYYCVSTVMMEVLSSIAIVWILVLGVAAFALLSADPVEEDNTASFI